MKQLGLVMILFLGMSVYAEEESNRTVVPGALSVELFGKGMLYSVQFDQMMNEDLAAGAGFGSVGLKTSTGVDLSETAHLIPVYVNYYFMPNQGSLFATVAASLVLNNNTAKSNVSNIADVEFTSAGVLPSFGLGYENRSGNGFLFRFIGYGVLGKTLKPWFGFVMGYAF